MDRPLDGARIAGRVTRDDPVVTRAGHPDRMDTFFASTSGRAPRIARHVDAPTPQEIPR